jgi:hypothetical protein
MNRENGVKLSTILEIEYKTCFWNVEQFKVLFSGRVFFRKLQLLGLYKADFHCYVNTIYAERNKLIRSHLW